MQTERAEAMGVAVAGAIALALAMGIGRFVYTPILPFMLDAGAIDVAGAGILASANFAGYLVGALGAIRVSAASRGRAFVAGVIVTAATTAAMALPIGEVGWLIIRFVSGVASAYALILTASIAGAVFARARWPGGLGAVFAGVGIGIVVSSALVIALASLVSWTALWLAAGLVSLPAAIVAIRGLSPWASLETSAPAHRDAVRPGVFWGLVTAYGAIGFGYIVQATYLPTMVARVPEIAAFKSWTWLVVGLAAAPSTVFWSWIAERVGLSAAIPLTFAVAAVGAAASLFFGTTLGGTVVAALCSGGTFVGVTVLILGRGIPVAPYGRTAAVAILTAAFGVGQALGPLAAGLMVARTGDFDAALAAALAALIAGCVVAAITGSSADRRQRQG